MIIYRYEDAEKRVGIYCQTDSKWRELCGLFDISPIIHNGSEHPSVGRYASYQDEHHIIENFDETMYCGFISTEQLCNWFDEEIRAALELVNCKIFVYDVPDEFVFSSQYQAIFKMAEATCLGEYDLKDGTLNQNELGEAA
jgi:hypothetical protein